MAIGIGTRRCRLPATQNVFKWALLLGGLFLIGCVQQPVKPPINNAFVPAPPGMPNYLIGEQLQAQYLEWQGTPYRLGGDSRRGVDCSAFVQRTFAERFGVALPRTTALQHGIGGQVDPSRLQVGDLVFFRTEFKSRHVGIYMGDQTFLHASTSRGVTLSRLDDPYWAARYWKTKRVVIP